MKFIISLFLIGILIFLVNNVNVQYNKEQIIIAKVMAAEACGEGEIGMYLVANVILNRANKYNKTTYQVVTQKNQFFGLTAKNSKELYQECKPFADELTRKINALPDLTNGALYFKLDSEELKPWHRVKTLTYKNHTFYR